LSYARTPKDLAFYEGLGPEHIVNREKPEVEDEAEYWYSAFQELSCSRAVSMAGALPIPLSEIDAYCRFTCVPHVERASFLRIIRQVDLGYLDLLSKEAPKLKQPGGG